jgi:YfiH family protein
MTAPIHSQAPAVRFDLPGCGQALFTLRASGNFSTAGGERHEHAASVRERLREELGLRRLCAGPQVHGALVQRVRTHERTGEEAVPTEADGHATALGGVGVMVLAADCLPVALGAPGVVAMLHAGWRGLAAGVLEEGVRALSELGAGELIGAVIGPGAGVCCYEVGPDVHDVFAGDHREGCNLNLRAIAREKLLAAGVASVRDVDSCTICDERFFSHRREGARAGRQAGVAWLS